MILHRVADDVGDLDEPAVVLFMQRPENAPLHRLEAVRKVRYRAVANDIRRVFEEAGIDAPMKLLLDLARRERPMRHRGNVLGQHMALAVAVGIAIGRRFGRVAVGGLFILLRQFRLFRRRLAFCCAHVSPGLSHRQCVAARLHPRRAAVFNASLLILIVIFILILPIYRPFIGWQYS